MLHKRLQGAAGHSAAIIVSLIMIIPVYLIITNAFKSAAQASSMSIELPTTFYVENFLTVVDKGKLATSFFNSVLYASVSTILGTFFCSNGSLCAVTQPNAVKSISLFLFDYGYCTTCKFLHANQNYAGYAPD